MTFSEAMRGMESLNQALWLLVSSLTLCVNSFADCTNLGIQSEAKKVCTLTSLCDKILLLLERKQEVFRIKGKTSRECRGGRQFHRLQWKQGSIICRQSIYRLYDNLSHKAPRFNDNEKRTSQHTIA